LKNGLPSKGLYVRTICGETSGYLKIAACLVFQAPHHKGVHEAWKQSYKYSKRGCIQKFADWPPGTRTANGTALCH